MPGDDGIEESFTAFVRASGEQHLRVAALLTGDWHTAEDLVQTSLVKLYRAWPGVDQADGDPDAYLRRIMINTQRSWWRARWRREAPSARLPDRAAGGEDADQRALALSVRQALQRLSPRQRAVLVLRYYQDLTEAEIASLLGCSAGTVKAHAHRGLRALRGSLGGPWPTGDPPPGDQPRSRPPGNRPAAAPPAARNPDPVLSGAGGTTAGEGSDPR